MNDIIYYYDKSQAPIGKGSFSQVFKGYFKLNDKIYDCAIKILEKKNKD